MSDKTENVRDESRGFDAMSDKNMRDESRGFDAMSDKNVRDDSRGLDAPTENKETTTLDSLFKELGNCGRFQIVFTTYAILPIIPAAWTMLFMAFGGYNPGWRCQDEPFFNATQIFGNNTQILITPETYYEQNNTERRKSLESCDTLRLCKNLTFSESASTIVTEWALVCDNSWVIPVITSIQMVGLVLGNVVGGQIGEKFGRKFSIYGSTALSGLANIIAIFSPSWQMYAAVRFFLGLSGGGIVSSLAVYISEFASPRGRIFIGGSPFWNMSTFSFALCVMALKNWRYIHLATALVSLVAFLPVFWLPESLRFLTVHGKLERANKVVKKIAKKNKKPIPDTSIMKSITNKETEDMRNRSVYSYLDLFHKNLRKSTIVLALTWFSFSLGYYMIGFGIRSLSGDFFVNFLLFSVISVPVRLIALALANRDGRRFACLLFIFLSIISSISVVAIQIFVSEESKSTPTLVMALVTSMMVEAPWGIVVTLVVEHNPTAVRNLSYGFCNAMARVASILAPYVIPKESLPMYGSFLLITFLQLACFVGHLILPETKGKPLHDNLMSEKESKSQCKTSTQT